MEEYFENTPKGILDMDLEELKPLNDFGPDVLEYDRQYGALANSYSKI